MTSHKAERVRGGEGSRLGPIRLRPPVTLIVVQSCTLVTADAGICSHFHWQDVFL